MIFLKQVFRQFSATAKQFREVDSLPIPDDLRASLRGIGVSRLTRIQAECFPVILGGQSCVGIARTGEGKTLAYLVPVIARMMTERLFDSNKTSCIIVLPTKDLCQQVGSVLVSLVPTVNVLMAFGKPHASFTILLRQKPHVLIGTGGRIAALSRKGEIDLKSLKMIVIDELDSLINHEYCKEVTPLIESLIPTTQVIGIGASQSVELKSILSKFSAFAKSTEKNTVRASTNMTPDKINHVSVKVPDSRPLRVSMAAALIESRAFAQAIVFTKDQAEAKAVSCHPLLLSKCRVLHGNLPQEERERTLNHFRAGHIRILVCTDVASRGLDIQGVDLVLSLSPPYEDTVYLHRCGRTGRAGRTGESILLYSSSEKNRIDEICSKFNFSFRSESCLSKADLRSAALESLVQQSFDRKVTTERFPGLISHLQSLSLQRKAAIVTTCIKALLGPSFDAAPPKVSILSGQPEYTPVLFVDPARNKISSRGDMMTLLERLNLTPGLLAMSESGFVVDLPTQSAVSLLNEKLDEIKQDSGVEPVLVDKLPKLIPDTVGEWPKLQRAFPWRRGRGKNQYVQKND